MPAPVVLYPHGAILTDITVARRRGFVRVRTQSPASPWALLAHVRDTLDWYGR